VAYITMQLDELNVIPEVAMASGVDPGRVAFGLLKLKAWCFRADKDVVTETHLSGFFGAPIAPALEAFGFLEKSETGWRVVGASKLIEVKKAQREGGKRGRAKSSSTIGTTLGSTSRSTSGSTSAPTTGSEQALSPNTNNLTPNITTTTKEPTEQEASGAIGFWRFFMEIRQAETGRIPEAPPHPSKLGRWYSDAMMELGGSDSALREAIRGYGSDKYWREAGYPFAGFAKQWRKYAALDAVPKA